MTLITLQDGKVVLRDGAVGTEQACCCGGNCPPGSDCCGTAEYLLDYCEQVDGEWVVAGSCPPQGLECLPCECDPRFTQTELIELQPEQTGLPMVIRILRCFVRDCDAVADECCGPSAPEDCLGVQWPGDRFVNVTVGPGGAFQFFQIGCYENPLP